ncbi:MAG: hypothetical protein MHMPM18_004610 [Marteilia pararefringens]
MSPDESGTNDDLPSSPFSMHTSASSRSPNFFSARNDVFGEDHRRDRQFASSAFSKGPPIHTNDHYNQNNNNNNHQNNNDILLQPKSTINEILLRNSYRNWLSESNNSRDKGDADNYNSYSSYFDSTRRNDRTTGGSSLFYPRPKSMDDFLKSTASSSSGFEEPNTISSPDSHSHSYEGHIVEEYFDQIIGRIEF